MKQAKNFAVHAGWKVIIADLGVAPGDLLALSELPADLFSRKDAVLSPPEYFRLFESLEQLVGESHLPLRLGGAISVEAFDPALFACLCSPDFNVALTRLATRQTITPLEAELVALPEPAKPCEAFLGCSLRQGDCNRIRFSKEDASRPFLTENVSMWQFFEPKLRTRLSKLEAGATTQERVHSALLDMLPSGRSSIQDVSSRLAMSKRSLQRHLADEALNYQEILNDTRQGLARHYLSRSNLSPGEIAFLIGFMDANSFLRAFKAWTGMTPGEYRRQHSYSM